MQQNIFQNSDMGMKSIEKTLDPIKEQTIMFADASQPLNLLILFPP